MAEDAEGHGGRGEVARRDLLRPCPDDWLEAWPVSTHVNKPANDDAECIEPLGGDS